MTQIKFFILNGQKFYTKDNLTLQNITTYFDYNTSLFVLEYNNVICNKKNWDKIFIQNQDKIEIVTIVGGG